MSDRPALELADIIRAHGEDYRQARGGKQDFLLPVKVLSAVFRGKFLDYLKRVPTSLWLPGIVP